MLEKVSCVFGSSTRPHKNCHANCVFSRTTDLPTLNTTSGSTTKCQQLENTEEFPQKRAEFQRE